MHAGRNVNRGTIDTTSAAGQFGRYKKEEKKEVRQANVRESESIRQIIEVWKTFDSSEITKGWSIKMREPYNKLLERIKHINYSANDVEKFSIMLIGFQDERDFEFKAGLFLSALINNGKDRNYVIHIANLEKEVACFGYLNTKNISINGDIGQFFAFNMIEGEITVNGSAKGVMAQGIKGGTIIIKRHVLVSKLIFNSVGVGDDMQGGDIQVYGNVYGIVGLRMSGGEIYVGGVFQQLGSEFRGGRIYNMGEWIYPKQ